MLATLFVEEAEAGGVSEARAPTASLTLSTRPGPGAVGVTGTIRSRAAEPRLSGVTADEGFGDTGREDSAALSGRLDPVMALLFVATVVPVFGATIDFV